MITVLKKGPLLVQTHTTLAGQQVVEVTLNAPEALNALNGVMVDLLLQHVPVWEADDNVIAIVMRGSGSKSFCAGGDVRQLYHEINQGNQHIGEAFFNHEYALDLMLHRLSTPLLVWGSGYVIGGGMGLLQGAAIRIGTHSSRLAMPEITIGLFPDVGASYFLRQVPEGLGLFLGLTGAMLNGTDARQLGLLDALLDDNDYSKLLQWLTKVPRQSHTDTLIAAKVLMQGLEAQALNSAQASNVTTHQLSIRAALNQPNLASIVASLVLLKGQDKWLDKAIATMEHGSPTSLHLFYRAFNAGFTNVADALLQEYVMGVNATRLGEFKEGVRALLIDKDRTPNWRYHTVEEIPNTWIDQFFNTDNVAPAHFS
jgi:enoyl-CoA hydratase/carnithine racemase